MNKVKARVNTIEATDVVTYVHLDKGDTTLRIIKSETPYWIKEGEDVICTFREASVCVSRECPGKISIENAVPATLEGVRERASLCELTFDSGLGRVVSLITTKAYENLGLEPGCKATMLLRGIDINLEPSL